ELSSAEEHAGQRFVRGKILGGREGRRAQEILRYVVLPQRDGDLAAPERNGGRVLGIDGRQPLVELGGVRQILGREGELAPRGERGDEGRRACKGLIERGAGLFGLAEHVIKARHLDEQSSLLIGIA